MNINNIPIKISEEDLLLHDHTLFQKLWDEVIARYNLKLTQANQDFWGLTKVLTQEINFSKGRTECRECDSSGFFRFGPDYCKSCNGRGHF